MSEQAAADFIFSLEQLSFAYETASGGRHRVLRDVSFALRKGQHVGLYGPNGSGKTTLFRCITGLARPFDGRILHAGRELRTESDFQPLRRKVGFLLQNADDQLFFPTVLEDVAFGPLNLGLAPKPARERALLTLQRLDIADLAQRFIHRLSGGEKRLVALASVLAMQPEALLLDEPTTGLDEAARTRLIEILRGIPTARITVSHDWEFLTQVSDSFVTIRNGWLSSFAPYVAHTHIHAHPLGNTPHGH